MRLATVFTDGMVLQARMPVRVFGEGRGSVKVDFLGETAELFSNDGQWCVELSPREYGGPYEMNITLDGQTVVLRDVYVGEVWIAAGQSNMEMPLFATEFGFESARMGENDKIRFFTVPRRTRRDEVIHGWHFEPVEARDTPWQICTEENALHFSAIGFHVAVELQKELGCAIGVISLNWGARRIEAFIDIEKMRSAPVTAQAVKEWDAFVSGLDMDTYMEEYGQARAAYKKMYDNAPDRVEEVRIKGVRATVGGLTVEKDFPNGPYHPNGMGVLYETMYKRVLPYGIRGILWYQGESNASDGYLEKYLLYMDCMRESFKNPELDFYAVELASFDMGWGGVSPQTSNHRFVTEESWAFRRELQQKATEVAPRNYLVTNMELGDIKEIHPITKKALSHRMVLKMLKHTYGFDVYGDHPTFKSATFDGNRVIIELNNAEGLFCPKTLNWVDIFVADESHELKKADTVIEDNKLILTCKWVERPVLVRYAFDNYYQGKHIYNKMGLDQRG